MRLKLIQHTKAFLILAGLIMIIWKIPESFFGSHQQSNPLTTEPPQHLVKGFSNLVTTPTARGNVFPVVPIPSVICGHRDGIGNQLFRYAFAYSLSQQLGAQLYLYFDQSKRSGRKFTPRERSFALDQFQLDTSKYKYLTSMSQLPRDKNLTVRINEVNYFKNNIPKDKIIILDDYWEAEMFFKPYKDEIVEQFHLKNDLQVSTTRNNRQLIKLMEESESVAVHFRYGDFQGGDRVIPFSYQWKAMQLMTSILRKRRHNYNMQFFIFSDNVQYVKKQVEIKMSSQLQDFQKDHFQLIFVSNENRTSVEEFYLMHKCKHMITPNSTFSWWAAYLIKNKNKIVIAPYPRHKPSFFELWRNHAELKKCKMSFDRESHYPNDWITLNPYK